MFAFFLLPCFKSMCRQELDQSNRLLDVQVCTAVAEIWKLCTSAPLQPPVRCLDTAWCICLLTTTNQPHGKAPFNWTSSYQRISPVCSTSAGSSGVSTFVETNYGNVCVCMFPSFMWMRDWFNASQGHGSQTPPGRKHNTKYVSVQHSREKKDECFYEETSLTASHFIYAA